MKPPTLLIADDLPENLYLLGKIIDFGFPGSKVLKAANGEESLTLAEGETPDLALLDMDMPVMDGLEACKRLKANPSIRPFPIIIITAHYTNAEIRSRALEAGADDFITKPVDNVELIARIKVMLRIKKNEEELRATNERLDLALEGARLALWDIAIPTGKAVFNQRWAEMLGFSLDEIEPHFDFWKNLIHPEDLDRVNRNMGDHLEGRTPFFENEHRLRSKEGTWKWVLTRGKVVRRDESGEPLRLTGIHIDITERKQAENRIQSLTRDVVKAQEAERQRISLDLHDNVAQNLAAARIACDLILLKRGNLSPELERKISKLSGLLEGSIASVRSLAYDLRPPALEQLGLVRGIGQHCAEFSRRNGLAVEFVSSEDFEAVDLDYHAMVHLYRLVQEGLNNIKKHAEARHARVSLTALPPSIILKIEDDGKGFDPEASRSNSLNGYKLGLRGMADRTGLLGGTLTIQSDSSTGTKILIEIPIEQ